MNLITCNHTTRLNLACKVCNAARPTAVQELSLTRADRPADASPRRLLASTMLGDVMAADGIVYILTRCCNASGKGATRGVICRACYRTVSDVHGWGALAADLDGAGEVALAGFLRPSLAHFAEQAAADVFAYART